jgi:energy-coupling factor transport system permease protein
MLRMLFRIVFAGGQGSVVLLPLPVIALPDALGVTLLGDVTAESVLTGLYDGLRLATMLICLGAANALANPRRLLRSMPAALHEVSTAVVVALSVFPQLAESLVRVRRARRLRPGAARGVSGLRSLVIPVLEDALDRSLLLAASMDSRGYGRRGQRSLLMARVTGGLVVVGLCGVAVGVYGLLDEYAPRYLATPFVLAGVAAGVVGLALSGRGAVRSAYRPDHWRLAEVATAASGLVAGLLFSVASSLDGADLNPSLTPLAWPRLTPLPLLAAAICVAPLLTAPNRPHSVGGPHDWAAGP